MTTELSVVLIGSVFITRSKCKFVSIIKKNMKKFFVPLTLHYIIRRSLVTSTTILSKPISLNPWYICGFTDGEGS